MGRVLGDLAAMGYNARWGVLGADSYGANHHRHRIWIYADTNDGLKDKGAGEQMGFDRGKWIKESSLQMRHVKSGYDERTEPEIPRMADDVAGYVDRCRAIGNGQHPGVAALAWQILSNPQI